MDPMSLNLAWSQVDSWCLVKIWLICDFECLTFSVLNLACLKQFVKFLFSTSLSEPMDLTKC